MAHRDESRASDTGFGGVVSDVSPVSLLKRQDDFLNESEVLGTAWKDAMGALAALGDFWGGDEYGRVFHDGAEGRKGYRTAMEEVEQHVGHIKTAYTRIGNDLGLSGANLAAAGWATIGDLARTVFDGELATPATKAEVG